MAAANRRTVGLACLWRLTSSRAFTPSALTAATCSWSDAASLHLGKGTAASGTEHGSDNAWIEIARAAISESANGPGPSAAISRIGTITDSETTVSSLARGLLF